MSDISDEKVRRWRLRIEECRLEECLRWARNAKTEDERKAFLDMARTWTKAASLGEAASDIMAQPRGKETSH
jgi:hypothetical protein